MGQVMMQHEEITQEDFVFPQGLAGFGASHHFGFIYQGSGDMVCMQSLEQPEAAFILTPWDEKRLGKKPTLNDEQRNCLQVLEASDKDDILWMLVLNPFVDKEWVTANLRAPIALHMEKRRGIQCITHHSELSLRYRWMPQPSQSD